MKSKFLVVLIGVLLSVQTVMAQAPKWVAKAQKAVFSVVTYDEAGNILKTGNGFFVTEDGVGFSNYQLFDGAQKAVVVTNDGKEMQVASILGVNDMYDVVKFRVEVPKKVPFLELAEKAAVKGEQIYLLPYSTQKSKYCESGAVEEAMKVAGDFDYYTVKLALKSKMVSCPFMNEVGKVLAMSQPSTGNDTVSICYGIDGKYVRSLSLSAFAGADAAAERIGIRKGLPETMNDALVYLYIMQSNVTVPEYVSLLEEFVTQFPESYEGYVRRAMVSLNDSVKSDDEIRALVEEDLKKAVKVAEKKDDVYYTIARTIYNCSVDAERELAVGYEDALQYILKAQETAQQPVYTQLKGDIFFAQQKFEEAMVCYDEVNESELVSPSTYYSAAKTHQLCGRDVEEVLALMDSCVARCNRPLTYANAPYVLERADLNMQAGHYRQAWLDYNAYHDAVNGQVNDVFYYLRSQAAAKSRQYQSALDDLETAINLKPSALQYHTELAGLNLIVGRTEKAVELLEQVLAKDADYAEAYRVKGLCLKQLKKDKEACACFEKAQSLGDPIAGDLLQKYCK